MKRFFILFAAVTAVTLAAGTDLRIDGKFRQLTNGLPSQWHISAPGAAKIIGGEEWFSKALQLTAANSEVTAKTVNSFPVNLYDEVEMEAEIKGNGTAFLAVELLDANGKTIAIKRIATATATARFRDLKGSLRIRDYAQFAPAAIRLICGVTPGSTVAFDDIDAELDRD